MPRIERVHRQIAADGIPEHDPSLRPFGCSIAYSG